MDLSFIRSHRAATPDLSALLSRMAATQSASPTARAQMRLDAHGHIEPNDNPTIALFAGAGAAAATFVFSGAATFADLPEPFFSPCQLN